MKDISLTCSQLP